MEEADDINGMENDDNPGTRGNSLGIVPPGVENIDNDQEASGTSGAMGETEPEQSTRAQQATANELKRLAAKNLPGPGQGSGFVMGARRRESSLLSANTTFDVLIQQFKKSLADLKSDE